MGLRRRLYTGIRIARDSIDVLRDHPNLLWFPVLAGVAGVAFVALLLGGALGVVPVVGAENVPDAAVWAALAAAYLGTSYVTVLFTAGLMYAAKDALEGRQPSVRGGLRGAWEHKWTLLAWAVVSAVVGLVFRALQESDNIGSVVAGVLLSMSWAVVTYFAVPVVVFEDEGIRGLFGRSVDIVRDTWGESLGAEFGLGFVYALAFLGVAVVAAVVGFVFGVGTAVAVGLPLGVVLFVFAATLNGIAKVALYEYATTDEPPKYFENIDFDVGGDGDRRQTPTGYVRGRI
ncbi:DUF6159 family protein [Halobacterium litoreum]|uniref:DUF6159 family protein n=1 Tax=Halobacterium litoreum TaxID=2039234 RepID=A0ABD5NDW1_9EURY|nr:DUF6159 family protein [Halobacterium litoreum]UHH13926.1 DUF6159 family protein [Halobacterium litoreum]